MQQKKEHLRARRASIRKRKRQLRFRAMLIGISLLSLIVIVAVGSKDASYTNANGANLSNLWKANEGAMESDDAKGSGSFDVGSPDGNDSNVAQEGGNIDSFEVGLSDNTGLNFDDDIDDDGIYEEPTGWTVVIDAGHGGKDQGCAYGTLLEKDVNLRFARILQNALLHAGVEVVMTREEDEFLYLSKRVEVAETANADAFICIHADSYVDDTSINGLTVHYQQNATGGKKLAKCLQEVLEREQTTRIRKIMESDMYVLRSTSMPATLVELGFLTNQTDRDNLQSKTFLTELAKNLSDGILEYLDEKTKT